jgi:hypothetical protein
MRFTIEREDVSPLKFRVPRAAQKVIDERARSEMVCCNKHAILMNCDVMICSYFASLMPKILDGQGIRKTARYRQRSHRRLNFVWRKGSVPEAMLIVALFSLSFSPSGTLSGLRHPRGDAPEGCLEVTRYWLNHVIDPTQQSYCTDKMIYRQCDWAEWSCRTIFENETDGDVLCFNDDGYRCNLHTVVFSDSFNCTGGCRKDGLTGDAVAGIVIGVLAFIAIIVLCIVVCRRVNTVRHLSPDGDSDITQRQSAALIIRTDQPDTPPPGFGPSAYHPGYAAGYGSGYAAAQQPGGALDWTGGAPRWPPL